MECDAKLPQRNHDVPFSHDLSSHTNGLRVDNRTVDELSSTRSSSSIMILFPGISSQNPEFRHHPKIWLMSCHHHHSGGEPTLVTPMLGVTSFNLATSSLLKISFNTCSLAGMNPYPRRPSQKTMASSIPPNVRIIGA